MSKAIEVSVDPGFATALKPYLEAQQIPQQLLLYGHTILINTDKLWADLHSEVPQEVNNAVSALIDFSTLYPRALSSAWVPVRDPASTAKKGIIETMVKIEYPSMDNIRHVLGWHDRSGYKMDDKQQHREDDHLLDLFALKYPKPLPDRRSRAMSDLARLSNITTRTQKLLLSILAETDKEIENGMKFDINFYTDLLIAIAKFDPGQIKIEFLEWINGNRERQEARDKARSKRKKGNKKHMHRKKCNPVGNSTKSGTIKVDPRDRHLLEILKAVDDISNTCTIREQIHLLEIIALIDLDNFKMPKMRRNEAEGFLDSIRIRLKADTNSGNMEFVPPQPIICHVKPPSPNVGSRSLR